ncbi:putative Tetratricopeptide repeat (TPR)-like superfamily protein [Hibiscus syriacus]|uniref:Tetratricopeptide repeat (TPR)-like superfamily protein n=1 Tax=Hibiscus syriacus TaxID=106335 RepID=A0A6A3C584_HIBSY|nr:putative Tetratricopeptide repeat (TPR)-like superfamily protein [Hibiscus syriacus]
MYRGKWVYDESFPLHNSLACPSIRKEFDCLKYGHPDHFSLKFDGESFLKRFSGKKIMFIGDSLSLNIWQSLVCMLYAAVPNSNIIRQELNTTTISSVKFQDSLYLVDVDGEKIGRVLNLNSMRNGNLWKNIDVLVFNTWLWWWDYIKVEGKIVKDMDRIVAFKTALTTWAKWVDSDVETDKTRVIFQGISPSHYHGSDRGELGVTNCLKEMRPFNGTIYPAGLPEAVYVVKEVISGIKKPVHLLDITALSQRRKDAHLHPLVCGWPYRYLE